nr:hypothetical protein [Tanacetum cinerariifolium]GEY32946.1 hypothetical protein [Tanacetum cinerariifolium]
NGTMIVGKKRMYHDDRCKTANVMKKQKPKKPRRHDTKKTQPSGPTTNVEDVAFNKENVSKHSNDPLHSAQEIASLKRRVKKLERRQKLKSHGLKRLYKTSMPKAKGIVMQEPSETTTPTPIVSSQQPSKVQDKAKRAEEKRNRPPTKAQQRSHMSTYLKNMDGWKTRDLKNKSFADIQDLFNKAMKRVNMFVDMDTEVVESSKKIEEIAQEGSSKRARDELEQEIAKKQNIEDENESAELKRCLEIVLDDEDDVTIDATPLSSKSSTIVDYKIYKERGKAFSKSSELMTMFEHHVEDNVWKNQQGLIKVKNWKLYDSYGIHCVTMQNKLYYLLVEKMYPLTHHTLHQMFNDVKLQVDYECEIAYELLRLVKKQLREGYVAE